MKAYMDNSATTRVLPEVVAAMRPYFCCKYGNPSSLHWMGESADNALEEARAKLAELINAKPEEVIFTSGATESNNMAVFGRALLKKGNLVTTTAEHHAMLNPLEYAAKKFGNRLSLVRVDGEGFVDMQEFEKALDRDTSLASVIHANNEIGTIQELKALGALCREKGIAFHSDSAQGFTRTPIDVRKQNVDLLTLNSHKIHGPKGVGALFVREGTELEKVFRGGPQESNKRSGTENLPGIIGFVKAAEIGVRDMEKNASHMRKMRDRIIRELLQVPDTRLNGPGGKNLGKRLCNNANITFRFIEGEAIMLLLSMKGICVSTGSACSSQALEPSHVLKAIGLKHEEAHGSIRYSLSKFNSMKEVAFAIRETKDAVKKLRNITSFIPEIHSERTAKHAVTYYRR